jgi:hypothetical protein
MQLEQIRELQDRIDEERENLRLLQQTLEQERALRAHGGGARERARDVNRRIVKDRAVEPSVFGRASQNMVAAAMLLHNMPEPSNPRPVEPVMKSEDSSRLLPCSRPRVLPRGDAGLPQSSLRSPPDRRERPRFIPSTPNGTRGLCL